MRNRISGIIFVIVGLYLILVKSPEMAIDKLSPEFIKLYEPTSLIPPQYWSSGIVTAGIVAIAIGLILILSVRHARKKQ